MNKVILKRVLLILWAVTVTAIFVYFVALFSKGINVTIENINSLHDNGIENDWESTHLLDLKNSIILTSFNIFFQTCIFISICIILIPKIFLSFKVSSYTQLTHYKKTLLSVILLLACSLIVTAIVTFSISTTAKGIIQWKGYLQDIFNNGHTSGDAIDGIKKVLRESIFCTFLYLYLYASFLFLYIPKLVINIRLLRTKNRSNPPTI